MYDIRFMQSLFPAAEALAAAQGEKEPGAEHLSLASLDFQEGSARRVFGRVGADPDQFRAAVEAQHAASLRSIGIEDDAEAIDRQLRIVLVPHGWQGGSTQWRERPVPGIFRTLIDPAAEPLDLGRR